MYIENRYETGGIYAEMNIKSEFLHNFASEDFGSDILIFHDIDNGRDMPVCHWHPHYEIQFIVSGRYAFYHNQIHDSGTGPLILIHPPYSLHRTTAQPDVPYERYIITLTVDAMRRQISPIVDVTALLSGSLVYVRPDAAEMRELLDCARDIGKYRDDTMRLLYVASLLRRILMVTENGHGAYVQSEHTYIQKVLQDMAENLSSPKTAEEWAAHSDVCIAKFHRDFRGAVGKSYHRYLTDLRMTYAGQRLLAGDAIVDVAMDTGYSGESHFINAFRAYWGETPGKFREHR